MFSYLGGHEVIERWVLAANLNATGFLHFLPSLLFSCLGWPLEWTEIIIIFVPIFLPLVKTSHIDPLFSGSWWRSTSRPPSTRPRWPWRLTTSREWRLRRSVKIFAGALPFVFMVFMTMAVVYIFPGVALWLPSKIYAN